MPTDPIVLVGAGGHAKVVLDALLRLGYRSGDIVAWDQDPARVGAYLLSLAIEECRFDAAAGRDLHICVGDNRRRRDLARELQGNGARLVAVVHPHASVGEGADIADGCLIAAQSVVAPEARLGSCVIVNHGAIVDHDVSIGDFSHIAPNATLGGGVVVGEGVLVGAGATILPGVRVANYSVVGAGAVVVEDLTVEGVYAGVPTRRLR